MFPIELNTIPYWEDDDQELPEGIPTPRPDAPIAGLHYENEYHASDLCFAERL